MLTFTHQLTEPPECVYISRMHLTIKTTLAVPSGVRRETLNLEDLIRIIDQRAPTPQ